MTVLGTPARGYAPPLVLLAVTAAYLVSAYTYEEVARAMPTAVGWVMLALLALDVVTRTQTALGRRLRVFLNPAAEAAAREAKVAEGAANYTPRRQMSAFLWPGLFVLVMVLAGILAAVPAYVFSSMRFHGRWSLKWSTITALTLLFVVWFLFGFALRVPLYPGIFLSDF